jgi:hypothetical protein
VGLLLAGLAIVVLGAVVLYGYVRTLLNDRELRSWPQAEGKMLACEPEQTRVPGISFGPLNRNFSPVWTVKAQYEFRVGSSSFQGDAISNARPTVLIRDASHPTVPASIRDICARYAPGTAVSVHYDPRAPEHSFVYFRPRPGKAALLALGVFLVACGAFAVWIAAR